MREIGLTIRSRWWWSRPIHATTLWQQTKSCMQSRPDWLDSSKILNESFFGRYQQAAVQHNKSILLRSWNEHEWNPSRKFEHVSDTPTLTINSLARSPPSNRATQHVFGCASTISFERRYRNASLTLHPKWRPALPAVSSVRRFLFGCLEIKSNLRGRRCQNRTIHFRYIPNPSNFGIFYSTSRVVHSF